MNSRSSPCMYRMYRLCRAMYNLVQVSRRIVTDKLLVSENTCRSLHAVLRTHWYKFYTGMLICTKLEVQQEFWTSETQLVRTLSARKISQQELQNSKFLQNNDDVVGIKSTQKLTTLRKPWQSTKINKLDFWSESLKLHNQLTPQKSGVTDECWHIKNISQCGKNKR